MDSFQFIRYTAAYHKCLNFKQFASTYCGIYYPNQDVEFMLYLIRIGMPERKSQCIVSHTVLQERGILSSGLSINEIIQNLEYNGLTFKHDFIHGKNDILITPIAFVFMSMLNTPDAHFEYEFMIEETAIAFDLYKSLL